ncbi:conserved hypothetical protein [Mesorhizobium ventifaucium]|uniref:Lipoprotein n=1 Tax=Mesorhizobium ventifaucium TaxID=666020 RepID=A0ABM9DFI6_9HYPH|nr:conserved hypothetical protein [Mesorhizobium ventifaucium]
MGRNRKQATIGITLSIALAGVMGCTSWPPLQPTPLVATPTPAPKVVRRAAAPKVVNRAPKPVAAKKVVTVADEPRPPVIAPLGGSGGGSGGGGGGGW